MENIAKLIDEMIMDDMDFDEISLDDADMNISVLFSKLTYETELIDNEYSFKSNLKKLLFKYQDKFVLITFGNGFIDDEFPNRYEYSICIYDTEVDLD